MRRMFIIATVVIAFVLSIVIAGFQTPSLQARGDQKVLRVRRIQVNAESIAQLASGKKYVVDLTQTGVIYEFDSKTRSIDFTRVTIRTATGEVTMSSWLEKTFSKNKVAGWNSQHLSIGATDALRSVRGLPTKNLTPPTKTMAFQCGSSLCSCTGDEDCNDMFSTNVCGPYAACDLDSGRCVCFRALL